MKNRSFRRWLTLVLVLAMLTAATPTGRPKYQLICVFAARQSVPCSAPRRTSVR